MALEVGQAVKLLRPVGTPKRGHGVIKPGTKGKVSQIRSLKVGAESQDEITVLFEGNRSHYFLGCAEQFIAPDIAKV